MLVDSGLGAENHRRRPSGMWTVTTELRIVLLSRTGAGSMALGVRTDRLGNLHGVGCARWHPSRSTDVAS